MSKKILTERQSNIYSMYYGLNGYRKHTLQEIGNTFGVSKQRIHQIIQTCIRKIKYPNRNYLLDPISLEKNSS